VVKQARRRSTRRKRGVPIQDEDAEDQFANTDPFLPNDAFLQDATPTFSAPPLYIDVDEDAVEDVAQPSKRQKQTPTRDVSLPVTPLT
jgi:hypothetical protein